ncbi:glycoside hydrolase family 16 protein [Postia placenta MAD-698-R-SB12]|uniref:Glycoside hydrolase family 16 protein n=1 Tax=Postia placenta MAD-698-R-SB12 TaxID=670580 RepID=A0A1X6MX64_9APHY|nr:glycoside hydrolase family 16 protein [Postia placenta MAD-698-R-SB12]OSX60830.1 glycoside hydrolase family 16 protein [Postia placenta MAD-698-R-SB12]
MLLSSCSRAVGAMLSALPLLALLSALPGAAAQGETCNTTTLCSSANPCCSPYGYCGSGANFCFGGCDPLASHSLTSCEPEPVCQNANISFNSFDRILMNQSLYDGNASRWDFILNEGNIQNTSAGELVMLLTESNGGTRLSSTRYVHYGQMTARLKTGRWGGVVTAFITMSDIKDEIDWEFPGNETSQGQTNYFWQGVIPAQTAGQTTGNLTDTFSNYHDYTIDWQPDQLQWLVDGNVVRTLLRSSVTDNSTGVSRYPNTPSRIELSIWPAGISSEPQGTVEWAGGYINWNDSDYKSAGHFYAYVDSVSITCNDATPASSNVTSYVYGSNSTGNTPSISFSNKSTIVTTGAAAPATGSPRSAWAIFAGVLGAVALAGAF